VHVVAVAFVDRVVEAAERLSARRMPGSASLGCDMAASLTTPNVGALLAATGTRPSRKGSFVRAPLDMRAPTG